MWVVPENMVFSFAKNDDMVFSFSLPTGAYATTLLGTVFQDIDAIQIAVLVYSLYKIVGSAQDKEYQQILNALSQAKKRADPQAGP